MSWWFTRQMDFRCMLILEVAQDRPYLIKYYDIQYYHLEYYDLQYNDLSPYRTPCSVEGLCPEVQS